MLNLDYSSSSDASDAEVPRPKITKTLVEEGPPKKKRKLPSLTSTFISPENIPNPSHYQGRTLSRPKVQGDYPTHIYLAFPIPPSLKSLVSTARTNLPPLHSLIDPPPETDLAGREEQERRRGGEEEEEVRELHVSLSRPLYLRVGQTKELEVLMRDLGEEVERFSLSLSTLTTFKNDDLTRTFLSVNVGAGYPELQDLTSHLNTLLTSLHLPPYYETPLFHTSIAWALLLPEPRNQPNPTTTTTTPVASPEPSTTDAESKETSSKKDDDFPRVAEIPSTLLASLEEEFGAAMRKESHWTVREMRMRSGGVVRKFPFGGGR